MDQLEKTSEMTVPEIPYNSSNKEPLLKKYNIPIQHLDFDYVEKCTDAKELERILQILKSGEEGFYPQLLTRTEERLAKIKPTSRYIRKLTRVLSKKEIDEECSKEITEDLNNWLSDMDRKNLELSQLKHGKKLNLPEVRKSKEAKDEKDKENVPKRIKSTDYAAWDKYDVDTELLKMDLEEEKLKKEAEKLANEKHKKRTVKFNEFTTKAEASFEAQRENTIANEYFKAGEYENALEHYSNSIVYFPSATSFANRAATFLFMKKYVDAISDYEKALKYEPTNHEYILQLGKCYSLQRKWSEALACAETVIKLDPNNKGAQKLAENAKESGGKLDTNKVRLSITDVHTKSVRSPKKSILKKEEKTEIIPIPGTSKTCGPFYKVVHSEDPNVIKKEKEMINNYPKRVFMTNVEISSDDDDLEHIKTPVKNNSPWIKKDMCAGDNNNNICNSKVSKNMKNKSKKKVCQKVSKKTSVSTSSTLFKEDSDARENNEIEGKTLCIATEPSNQATSKQKEVQSPKFKNSDCKNDENKKNEKVTDELNPEGHSLVADSIHQQERTIRNLRQTATTNDIGGGGEPFIEDNSSRVNTDNVNMPFSFIQAWQSVRRDNTHSGFASILRNINADRITEVIGNKIDSTILSEILNCLYRHFMVANEVEKVYNILLNLCRLQRFSIVVMFLSEDDRRLLQNLFDFLKQHGQDLPKNVKDQYV